MSALAETENPSIGTGSAVPKRSLFFLLHAYVVETNSGRILEIAENSLKIP